jgi:cohesin loading factor subunit SCC2
MVRRFSLSVIYCPQSFQVSSLDDVKTSNKEENNAAKTIALEHLGVIAARTRSSYLKFRSANINNGRSSALKPLDEVGPTMTSPFVLFSDATVGLFYQIVAAADMEALGELLSYHEDVTSHLCKRSSEDQTCDVSLL